ncbi:AAA family ATPase [uncultured Roseovarius sp.]|uniref:ATP-dependent nuclease n=1 Tax=uncultured Roseovarius sp. TaxID=293344 RepID=UPI0026134187|nr:AAA family ATPase [uncultured Roseovarius sp.]
MRISKLKVENYRSIENIEVEPSEFGVFVGQNNHGKTNFFEAIQWFYNAKKSTEEEYFKKETDKVIRVEIEFSGVVDEDIEKLSTDAAKTKIRNLLGDQTSFSVVKASTDHKRKYIVSGEEKPNPQGLDTAINEFLPRLEYVNTKIRLDDVAKYKDRNPIGAMLSGVLTAIIESSEEYKKFREQFAVLFEGEESEVRAELDRLGAAVEVYLQKQFPDGTSVKFKVNPPQFTELLKSFDTTINDGIETGADAKGDGMQRAIMLSIIQAFADHRRIQLGGGTFLFLIDEAELHLHPSAQRALKNALLDICSTDQVLVNTHSSVLVSDSDAHQKVFRVDKEEGVTNICELDELGLADVIFELLGGSPADLLLPRNFLIVEGKSEFAFLTTVIRRFYSEDFKGLKVLFGGGDIDEQKESMKAVHKVLVPLTDSENPVYRDKVVVLIDKPNASQEKKYALFQKGYPFLFAEGRILELPSCSLEECYPKPWTKSEDEVKAMTREKVKYANQVASEISREQFEAEMPEVFAALNRCSELAFN